MKKPSERIKETYLELMETNREVNEPQHKATVMTMAIIDFLDEVYQPTIIVPTKHAKDFDPSDSKTWPTGPMREEPDKFKISTEPIEPPTRLIPESADKPVNEFQNWHTQGWNDLHKKIMEIKHKYFPEGHSVKLDCDFETMKSIRGMWEEFKELKK